MGPATITSSWLLQCHLSPMLAALGQGKWAIHAALGPSSGKPGPLQRWWGGRGIRQDPPIAHPDLCCPPQPAAGTRPHWGEANSIYTSLEYSSSHGTVCVGGSPRGWEDFSTLSKMSSCWTVEPSLSQSQALVIVSSKEILFPYYFYSFCPIFKKTTSKSLQVIAYIKEPRRTVWKKQRKTSRVMTREEFS